MPRGTSSRRPAPAAATHAGLGPLAVRAGQGAAMGGWAALVAAALLDPSHDALAHYVSWLVDGRYAWLGGTGVLAMAGAAAAAAWHVGRVLPAGAAAAATFLACAAVVGVAILLLPSRGAHEPLWRTAVHVALAVGAYIGLLGAASLAAWCAWQQTLPRRFLWMWVAIVVALLLLLVVSAIARLTASDVELRGLVQLTLAGAAAVWLAAALGMRER